MRPRILKGNKTWGKRGGEWGKMGIALLWKKPPVWAFQQSINKVEFLYLTIPKRKRRKRQNQGANAGLGKGKWEPSSL